MAENCEKIAAWMRTEARLDDRLAGSVPFQTMCAVAVAGWQLHAQARFAAAAGDALARTSQAIASFFTDAIVPEALGLKAAATVGAPALYRLSIEDLIG